MLQDGLRTFCGTAEYIAPEVLTQKRWSAAPLDWWAFGVLIYRMLAGVTPFDGTTTSDVFMNILTKDVVFPPDFPPDAQALVSELLNPELERRLRGDAVFNHPFFSGVDWEALTEKRWEPPPFVPSDEPETVRVEKQRVLLLPANPDSDGAARWKPASHG